MEFFKSLDLANFVTTDHMVKARKSQKFIDNSSAFAPTDDSDDSSRNSSSHSDSSDPPPLENVFATTAQMTQTPKKKRARKSKGGNGGNGPQHYEGGPGTYILFSPFPFTLMLNQIPQRRLSPIFSQSIQLQK